VQAMCDRVIIINKGQIVADETLEAIQAKYEGESLEDIFRKLTV
jgi:ABC-2 type transport system ATP-binding protein